jgi:hypothetical protein
LYGTYTSALTFERCLKRFGNCATTIRDAISRQVRSSQEEERLRGRGRETGIQWGRRGETQRELEREGGIERGVLGSAEESAGVEGLVFNAEGMEAGMSGRVRKHMPASMCMGTSSRVG